MSANAIQNPDAMSLSYLAGGSDFVNKHHVRIHVRLSRDDSGKAIQMDHL